MNKNFAAQIATRLDDALAAFRETGSEVEDGLAHGYSLVQDRLTSVAALVALAEGAKANHRETGTNFSLGVALAASRTVEMLDKMLKEA